MIALRRGGSVALLLWGGVACGLPMGGTAACGGMPFDASGLAPDAQGEATGAHDAGGDLVTLDVVAADTGADTGAADVVGVDQVTADVVDTGALEGAPLDAPPPPVDAPPPVDVVGDGCTATHSDGLGQEFFACTTDTGPELADQACQTWVMAQGGGSCVGATPSCTVEVFCGHVGASCACWGYGAGDGGGHVRLASVCSCPTSSDPAWD